MSERMPPEGWKGAKAQIQAVEGHLRESEAKCLYALAKQCEGNIVEIGSWKGKSTVCLALGSKVGKRAKVFAVDPHRGIRDDTRNVYKEESTEAVFRENVKKAGVEDIVVPLVMESKMAVKGWKDPVSLLFIDGLHDYENVKQDFELWSPFLTEGGAVCFHDAVYLPDYNFVGIRKVVVDGIFRGSGFSDISFYGSILCAFKKKPAFWDKIAKGIVMFRYMTLPWRYSLLAALKRYLGVKAP
jgi:predicted O-methyltransferase YrrM